MSSSSSFEIAANPCQNELQQNQPKLAQRKKPKREFCVVEGDIAAGKSSTLRELENISTLESPVYCERQEIRKWTALGSFYDELEKNGKVSSEKHVELQTQVATSYILQYDKYNFEEPKHVELGSCAGKNCCHDGSHISPIDGLPTYSEFSLVNADAVTPSGESIRKILGLKNQKCISSVLHPGGIMDRNYLDKLEPAKRAGGVSWETSDYLATNIVPDHNASDGMPSNNADTIPIFFEGILSNSGVFAPMAHLKGELTKEHYLGLVEEFDLFKKGIIPKFIFYLKPGASVCKSRLYVREDSAADKIPLEYLQDVENSYNRYFEKTSRYQTIFIIDNAKCSPKEIAQLIYSITMVMSRQ